MTHLEREHFEYQPEFQTHETGQFEWGGESEWGGAAEWSGEAEVLTEAEVMELSGELLEITNEAELDLFLGSLLKKVGRGLGKIVRSPIGQAVGGLLKGVAKTALPLAGTALGGLVGGPLGAQIGSGLASAGSKALGLETGISPETGMSPETEMGYETAMGYESVVSQEDREFQGASNFVKLAADATKTAVAAPPGANPAAVAQTAVKSAVAKYAPGLAAGRPGMVGRFGRTGRWVRQGRNIIIVNCR
jgi:hypothetical protein